MGATANASQRNNPSPLGMLLVALSPSEDLLLCAKNLFVHPMVAIDAAGGLEMTSGEARRLISQ
jgi:hypothetical protein